LSDNKTSEYQSVKLKYLLLILTGLITLTVIAYSPVSGNGFLNWDDEDYVYGNKDIQGLGPENLKAFFTQNYLNTYLPLTMISYAVDYKIGGLDPKVYTYTNLILHLLNTLFVFWFIFYLVKSLTKNDQKFSLNRAVLIATLTSGLFAIHPLNVESVAWVAERKNLLFAFFFIPSLITYVLYINQNRSYLYLLSLFLFICSLLSKGTAVSLTLCLIVLDYVFCRKLFSGKVILEKIPFLLLSLVFGLVAFMAQGKENLSLNHSFFEQIVYACYGFIQYLNKLLIPVKLSAFYSYPVEIGLICWLDVICVIILISLLCKFRKYLSNLLVFGFLFYISNLIFLIQIVPVGNTIMADRYIYIPSIGFFFVIALVFSKMAIKNSYVYILFVVTILAYGISTHERVKIWNNSIKFWNDVIQKDSSIHQAWNNLGTAEFDMGNIKGALHDFNRVVQIKPDYTVGYFNRANARKEQGDGNGALLDYSKALSLKPDYVEAYCNRGILKRETGDYQGSLKDLNLAVSINPFFKQAYNNRGIVNFLLGNKIASMSDFSKAILLDSTYADAYYNKGKLLKMENIFMDALHNLDLAVRYNPKNINVYLLRAKVKFRLNNFVGTIEDCDHVLDINNNVVGAILVRSAAYYKTGDYQKVVKEMNSIIQKNPGAGAFYYLRGMSKIKMMDRPGGLQDLVQARKLGFIERDSDIELGEN
jgi:protein O-mannosyl-transferase